MGESSAETLKEIDDTRERLGERLEELEERVPAAATVRWGIGFLAGGLGGTLLWMAVRRLRHQDRIPTTPSVIAAPPVHLSVQLLPEQWVRALETPRGQAVAAAVAGGWLLFKWMALRQRSR